VNDFVASAIFTGQIDILSDGSPWRPLIATDDMARAIEWALLRGGAPALAINVGSHLWTWQIRDLAHAVADVLGGTKVSINAAAQPDARSYKVDFSLFERLAPDHQPRKRFDDMVLELKDQVTALDLDGPAFRQSRFIRLNVLSDLKARGLITSGLFRT
jgi:nucleoside-diphosphate-sugar epimerase